jgi:molybdate transport system substrate-binding protein
MMIMPRRKWLVGLAAPAATTLLAWDLPQAPAQTPGGHVVVFAAASLKNALDAISQEWHRETGKNAVMSYAASSALAKQIAQGASAQIFIQPGLDGLCGAEEFDQAGDALQSAWQPHCAGCA